MRRLKLAAILAALMAVIAVRGASQAAFTAETNTGKITVSGGTFTHVNRIGALNLTFEELINGSPTTATITIQGCGRGNIAAYGSSNGLNGLPAQSATCDTLDTYTTTTAVSANRKITGLYDNYVVTATWSGGASQSVQVNVLATASSSPLSANDPCQSSAVAKSSTPVNISSATTTQLVAPSGNLSVYVCGFLATAAGTSPTLQFEYGTGATCGTGTTVLTGVMAASTTVPLEFASGLTNFKAPQAQGLCVVSGGTGPSFQGVLTFVQGP
jgi:hypothetical protein